MPIFEFECMNSDCKHTVEVVVITAQDATKADLTLCEKCGWPTKRVIALPAKGKVK